MLVSVAAQTHAVGTRPPKKQTIHWLLIDSDDRGLKRLGCSLVQPEKKQPLLTSRHFTIVLTRAFKNIVQFPKILWVWQTFTQSSATNLSGMVHFVSDVT